MTVIEKINNLIFKAGFLTSCGEFLTLISFLYGKVVYIDGDSEKIVWLWCCAIFAGLTLLFGGCWGGFALAKYYILLGDDKEESYGNDGT